MLQSEKLRNKLIESTHQPPHENRLLMDLPGEVWKNYPIAPYDEYFAVSNKGRIKALERRYFRINHYRILKERIIKQRVQTRKNPHSKKDTHMLSVVIFLNKIKKELSVPRMVYETFVGQIPDSTLIVRHIDGNNFNNTPENLYLYDISELNKALIKNGQRRPQTECYRKNPVSQYNLEGQLVATYNSRMEATKISGINSTRLSLAIRKEHIPVGGFFWRDGIAETSRIEIPVKKRLIRCRKVAQYSLKGDLIRVFPSVKIAAASINISPITLYDRIKKHVSPKGAIWKMIDDSKEIPKKIKVEPFVPIKKWTDTTCNTSEPTEYEYPFQNLSLQDMPGEQWKEIPDTGGHYFLSDYGRIKAIDRIVHREKSIIWQRGHIFHQTIVKYKDKYIKGLSSTISINKKLFRFNIPILVYTLFIGKIPPKHVVKHKDNDPLNCRVENLELRSRSDLWKHYFQQGRISSSQPKKQVAQYTLNGDLIATYSSLTKACEKTGFKINGISNCANGKTKKYKGFIWKFL